MEISSAHWQVGLVPENGGAVVFGRVRHGETWLDLLRPTPKDRWGSWWDAASYPLIPWSNRIRHGALRWKGHTYRLRRWGTEDFALHGTVADYPWRVTSRHADRVTLEFDSRDYVGVNFPWPFFARVEYVIDGPELRCSTTVTNIGDLPFPAGFGHHPYFVRTLANANADGAPVGDEVHLQVNCAKSYPLTNGMPDAGAGPVTPITDFQVLRPLGTDPVDDCLTGRSGPVAARLEYPGALTVDIVADALLSHVVLFIPIGESFFAVEPVTNANDGFNLHSQGVDGTGVLVVRPRESVTAEFAIVVR